MNPPKLRDDRKIVPLFLPCVAKRRGLPSRRGCAINESMSRPKIRRPARPDPVPPGFVPAPPVSAFFASLGKCYVKDGAEGEAPIFGLHIRPKHGNRHGTAHGGMLATLADTWMAAFVRHQRPEIETLWTLRLSLEFKRAVPMGAWLEGHFAGLERDGDFVTVHCHLRLGDTLADKATAVFKVSDKA